MLAEVFLRAFPFVILHNLSGTSFTLDDGELDYTESSFIFSNSNSACVVCWEMLSNEQKCKSDIGQFGLQVKLSSVKSYWKRFES